ncbi:MAG: aldehyde dehydrogenase family protein [Bacteroidetes bacterium]|nr:MAG: aldehyde dehydrogenase family protein [Bacteroidota bacterium]
MLIINPATETVIATLTPDTPETIANQYKMAKTAQTNWAEKSLAQRLAIIEVFSELLDAEKETLALTLSSEMGKPLQEALNEVQGARQRIGFFLQNSQRWLSAESITPTGGTLEHVTYEPLGVIANISAWNYPFLVGVNVYVPALAAGNAVLYKPSEHATLTGLHMAALWQKAGLPEGCFSVVVGDATAGEALLNLPLDGYFFTGSYRTGKHIAEKVAGKLVPLGLELGGKDPLYVADDVLNVKLVAEAVLEGAFYNNGQSCCAVERVYVHHAVYTAFLDALAAAATQVVVGSPLDKTTTNGPLSRKPQLAFLQGQVEDALLKGAQVLWQYQGTLPQNGYFFKPILLTNVNHDMRLMTEESFGPVLGIQLVENDEAAAALMADTPYGLTASVYSSSAARAENILKQMATGTVYWNCCDRVSANLPWSGRGQSGLGSTLGFEGIRSFVQPKAWHMRK